MSLGPAARSHGFDHVPFQFVIVHATDVPLTVAVQVVGFGCEADPSENPNVAAVPADRAPFHDSLPTVTFPPT